ncbi:MAG: hypothetical protein ACK4QW_05135, partial [Alphaproteobacteria bacterium]
MAVNPLSAAGAYSNAFKIGSAPGMDARGGAGSFADLVKEAGRSAARELRGAEELSAKAAAKVVDLPPSDALSILKNGPDSFEGRKLGVLLTDGADADLFTALKTAVAKEKA